MEIKGIEVSGEIYDIEDETARTNASEASSNASEAKTATQTLASTVSTLSDTVSNHSTDIEQLGDEIGDLADLETTAKTDLVSALNEVNEKANFAEQLDGNYITRRTRLDNLSSAGTGTLTGQGFTRQDSNPESPAQISLSQSILNFDEIEIECVDSLIWSFERINNYTSIVRRVIKLKPIVSAISLGFLQRYARTTYDNSSGDVVDVAHNDYAMAFTANNILSVQSLNYGARDSESEDSFYPQLTSVFQVWGIKHIKVE